MGMIKILVEQTGAEMCVDEEYYNKYCSEGLRYLGPVQEPDGPKDVANMSWEELKEACTLKGLTFKGNASKEELRELLTKE